MKTLKLLIGRLLAVLAIAVLALCVPVLGWADPGGTDNTANLAQNATDNTGENAAANMAQDASEDDIKLGDASVSNTANDAAVPSEMGTITSSAGSVYPSAIVSTSTGSVDEPSASDQSARDDNLIKIQQLPDTSFLYDTQLADLATADKYYDRQMVQVVGEAVGDLIRSSFDEDYKWVTLSATEGGVTSVLAVYMPTKMTEQIDTLGSYSRLGTTLQVRGTFYLACPYHDGITDLHAEYVTVTEKGSKHPDEFDFVAMVPGLLLCLVAVGLSVLLWWLRERQR